MTLRKAFHKLDEAREEFHAARLALREILRAFESDPERLNVGAPDQVTLHHLESCIQNLQITYLMRLFAEFEDVLRHYWLHGRRRSSQPRMIDLMDNIAAYCFINQDDLLDAHEIRDYRNRVVHEHLQDPRFDFQTCRSRLARFIRWLPQRW